MIEKFKSGLLAFLVLTSLIFSYTLWYGAPPYEFSKPITSERIHFSNPRSLSELIMPYRVVFSQEEGLYHVFAPGQELYQTAVSIFRSTLLTAGLEPATREEWLAAQEEAGLRLDFRYPYPLKVVDRPEMPALNTTSYYISLRGSDAWLMTLAGDCYRVNLTASRLDLLRRFSDAQDLTVYRLADNSDLPPEVNATFIGDIFLPLQDISLPVRQWEQETLDLERLLRVFFIDMSLVRRIEEKDGAVIYTDGQKGVRVYPAGAVEYTMAGGRGGLLSGEQALSMAGEIIALYGGWTADLFAWVPPGFDTPQSRHQLLFVPYVEGRPLISSVGGISLSVTERGAHSYFRNLVLPVAELQGANTVIPASLALQLAIEYAVEEGDGLGPVQITDFYLGYYLREPFGVHKQVLAAWFLEMDRGGLVVINAITGVPVAIHQF